MPKHFLIFATLSFAMTFCSSAEQAYAWQTKSEKIVVLTNRQTLQGEVTQQQGKVSVGLPSGSVIVLPDSRVEFVSESFGEAYWQLAGRTRSTDLQGQIGVFKWCLRYELFDEAANHLLILQEMNIPAKTLMQLDVSLQITQKRHRETLSSPTSPPAAVAAVSTKNIHDDNNVNPIAAMQSVDAIEIPDLHQYKSPRKSVAAATAAIVSVDEASVIDEFGNEVDSMVRSVSWDQPISEVVDHPKLPSTDAALLVRLDSTDSLVYADLDRLARSMPRGSVGLFRTKVEPILQKACSQCHQANNSACHFEIFQSRQGEIDRRMSQKNLYQSLNLSDREQPSESLLIKFATTAHGGQTSKSFQWEDSQLSAMKQWLIMVSENPSLPIEAFSSEIAKHNFSSALPPVADHATDQFSQRLPRGPVATESKVAPSASKIDPTLKDLDPFNAELFNQNFGSR